MNMLIGGVDFWIVIAYDNQTLVSICVIPFPQRGNYPMAVYSAKGPHIDQDHAVAQIC